jgi:hypothetical protein
MEAGGLRINSAASRCAPSAGAAASLASTLYEHVLVSPPDPETMTSEADIHAVAIVNGQRYFCQVTVQVQWIKP